MELVVVVVIIAAILLILRRILSKSFTTQTGNEVAQPPEEEVFEVRDTRQDAIIPSQSAHFDAASAQPVLEKRVIEGRVYVTDGDTITISRTQIRLFGIDAPELNHPYGVLAKRALQTLCKGQVIRAEVTETDHHGRTVAHCLLPDGRDLSAEMVKLGLAIDWPKFSGGKFKDLETADARRKLFLADARQKGRVDVWEKFEAKQKAGSHQP